MRQFDQIMPIVAPQRVTDVDRAIRDRTAVDHQALGFSFGGLDLNDDFARMQTLADLFDLQTHLGLRLATFRGGRITRSVLTFESDRSSLLWVALSERR